MRNRYGRLMLGARSHPRGGANYAWDLRDLPRSTTFTTNPMLPDDEYLHEARAEEAKFGMMERPDPLNYILLGRRGTGKTLLLSIIGDIFTRVFASTTIDGTRQQRTMSNFWIRTVQDQGEIAWEYQTHEIELNKKTEIVEDRGLPQVRVMPCDPEHSVRIPARRPKWAYDNMFLIDEIADIVSNLRPNAKESRTLGEFLRQQRKYGMEICAATQFIWQVSKGTAAVQFDIFTKLRYDRKAQTIKMSCYDFWSNKLDRMWKYTSGLDWSQPPDWERTIHNVDQAFGMYNTDQIIPPVWSSNMERARMYEIQRERWKSLGRNEDGSFRTPPEKREWPVGDIDASITPISPMSYVQGSDEALTPNEFMRTMRS